jgi:hypothetical protein
VALHVSAVAVSPAAEALPQAWTCLPEQTVAIARIPGGRAFFEALTANTKLGSVLANPERLDKLAALLRDEDDADWDELVAELAKYKLKPDDLKLLFAGELGAAITVESRGTAGPLGLIFGWIEPGDDLAERLYAAVQQAIEEREPGDATLKRSDLEIAGQNVMHLRYVRSMRKANIKIGASVGGKRGVQAERDVEIDEEQTKGEDHFFVTRIGNRIAALAHVEGTPLEPDSDASRDVAERAQQAFGQFLEAHRGAEGGRSLTMMEAPGLAAALPAGLPAVEIVADTRPVVKMFLDAAGHADEKRRESADRSARLVKALALDALGPLAYRSALDGNLLRTGIFLGAAEPRTGLAALLDQAALPAHPPAWVSSEVVSYEQLSFDLGKAYVRLKEMLIEQLGDETRAAFDLIENQVSQRLDTDIDLLLSSLGTQHSAVSFPAKADPAKEDADGDVSVGGNRSAVVWQVKDEALWKRVLQLGATFAGQEPVEEQGFLGLRLNHPSFEGGVFLGRGFLVVGAGADVIESVLAMLRNPPAGSASLAGSPLAARAAELLAPAPGLTYQINDNNRNLKAARKTIEPALQVLRGRDANNDAARGPLTKAQIEIILGLIPSETELEGVLGVGVSQSTLDDTGLTNRGVLELPRP